MAARGVDAAATSLGYALFLYRIACLPPAAVGLPEEFVDCAVEPGREDLGDTAHCMSLLQSGHAMSLPEHSNSVLGSARLVQDKPNIVVFLPDDMFMKEYSWWLDEEFAPPEPSNMTIKSNSPAHVSVVMPNLARIAQTGATFRRAHSTSSLCAPSRYSIMTSRYPSRSEYGMHFTQVDFSSQLPFAYVDNSYALLGNGYADKQNTVPAALRALGYTTGMTGKWHLTPNAEGGTFDWPYSEQRNSVKEAGFDFVEGLYINPLDTSYNKSIKFSHNLEWTLVEALRFMDNSMRSHIPFFLYFAPTPPHDPHLTERSFSTITAYDTPAGRLSELPDVSKYCSSCTFAPRSVIWGSTANISSLSRVESCRGTLAAMRWLDESLGVLYQFLSERGAIANTYIVMSSDHGFARVTLYEMGTRVPLYAVGPSIIAGTVVDELVSHIDLGPTFLEWATGGASQRIAMDGQSWAALASGKVSSLDRGGIYTEMMFDRAFLARNGIKHYNSSTTKMLESMGFDRSFAVNLAGSVGAAYPHMYEEKQIYNLSADPTEQVNIFSIS